METATAAPILAPPPPPHQLACNMKLQRSAVFKILFLRPSSAIDVESLVVTIRIPEITGPNQRRRSSNSPEGFFVFSMGNSGIVKYIANVPFLILSHSPFSVALSTERHAVDNSRWVKQDSCNSVTNCHQYLRVNMSQADQMAT
jgi:hypothetical protein